MSTPATSIDALPPALLLGVLLKISSLDTRVRCASLVAKSWAALLREPAFWAELSFEGANAEHLDDSTLLALAQRASGKLVTLDVTADACSRVTLQLRGEPLLRRMALDGLLGSLVSLSAGPRQTAAVVFAADARLLRASCPALSEVRIPLEGDWPLVAAVRRILPFARDCPCVLRITDAETIGTSDGEAATSSDEEDADGDGGGAAARAPRAAASLLAFPAFASAAAAALRRSPAAHLTIRGLRHQVGGLLAAFRRAEAADPAAALRAASRLGAALADPRSGPDRLSLDSAHLSATPVLESLCRALTEGSPLRVLDLSFDLANSWIDDPDTPMTERGAAELAAALSPGRSRLRALSFGARGMVGDDPTGGCAARSSSARSVYLSPGGCCFTSAPQRCAILPEPIPTMHPSTYPPTHPTQPNPGPSL